MLRAGNMTAVRLETLTSKESWIGNGPSASQLHPSNLIGPLFYRARPGPQLPGGITKTPLRLFPELKPREITRPTQSKSLLY